MRQSVSRYFMGAAIAFVALLGMEGAAQAQTAPASASDTELLEIEAENGIEWLRNKDDDSGSYYARGNAWAKQGDLLVVADELAAHYRKDPEGRQKIHLLEATGNVSIRSGQVEVEGGRGRYNLDTAVMMVEGKGLRLVSGDAVVTARKVLEYRVEENRAIAEDNAIVTHQGNRMRADILTAILEQNAKEDSRRIKRIEADGHVVITTPAETVKGKQGVYEVAEQRTTMCGDVEIIRGESRLFGECAEVDMKRGRSVLKGRVRALVAPADMKGEGSGAQ